jgi:hypothetical protein
MLKSHSFAVVMITIMVLSAASGAEKIPYIKDAISLKSHLSLRLDSLEMLKQSQKRDEKPFEQIEKECALIRDSIAEVRSRMEVFLRNSGTQVLSVQSKTPKADFFSDLLNRVNAVSAFDWILLAAGFIAIISGFVLLAGLIRLVIKGRRRKKKPHSGPNGGFAHKPSVHDRTEPETDLIPAPPEDVADNTNEDVESLRDRISQDIKRIQRFDRNPNNVQYGPDGRTSGEEAESLRAMIIKEAQTGMDVQQISRKYQMSLDQIALILRMAGKAK